MKILLIILAAVFLAVWVTRWQGNKYRDFKANALQTQATVTLREERRDIHKQQRHDNIIEYRFVLAGREYTGRDKVEFEDLWTDILLGDSIAVYYDRTNPSKNIPAALLDRRLGLADKLEN